MGCGAALLLDSTTYFTVQSTCVLCNPVTKISVQPTIITLYFESWTAMLMLWMLFDCSMIDFIKVKKRKQKQLTRN